MKAFYYSTHSLDLCFEDISLGWVTGNRGLNGGLPPSQPQRGGSGTLHGLTGYMKPWPCFGTMWLFKRLGVGKPEAGRPSQR